ncbi:hypothetical protein EI53_01290 [Fusobacterium naviforme]|nr:hypothetical protein F7P78_06440 [Fusobacterium naviforme]PSL10228.1 hypothetical protein EI53_01290 [Fusobacterium naviforme]STO27638.1 Uncharacterised protein [Fusobacterium naviforme]
MSRQATKAVGNRYFEARMRAAKYNEKLLTRAGGVECLPGVTEDSLKKYELDITRPPNVVVALMADAYNEPELRQWYCVNECPLGRDCREIPEMPAERALIRLQNTVYEMEKLTREISLLMDNGEMSEDEQQAIPGLRDRLLEFRRRADENLAVLERAARVGKFM